MSVLVVGMSHRSAPVSLLERLSMDDSVRDNATRELLARESLTEAMIVSTCNRMEVYVMTSSFHSGVSDVVEILHGVSGVDMETLRSSLYVRYADAAAEHMMVVTSGLDSMVIGEQQIIGQVRTAYQAAIAARTVGPALHSLVQASLHTGKRVHTETEIDDAGASMVSFAFDEAMAHLQLESLQGKSALVLGAGAMASLAATHLGRLGIDRLVVANRTRERAERLAQHSRQAGVDAEVVDFDQRAQVLSRVDIAVSATGSQSYTITAADVPPAHDLMLVDLSLPRDIDDAVTDKGARLVNIERLHAVRSGQGQTTADAQAQAIVAEELKQYCSAQRIKDVAPAVSALRRHAADLVDTELSRLRSRVDNLNEAEFVEVANTVRRVVDKLLHQPTIKAKELAASSGVVSYESALQEFFGLTGPTRSVKVNYEALPSEEELGA
ncbi:glutamyl-tRNA reductase [Corynebacterium felinum]|uniref:Glutamyl-tRNA reductase n=1 Tax=Corynebacterium felinum TaxID=131318 RepID=A0ABU2B7F9_9CORY|nr:glutamyl-tRNA reductase [Corynebacterium felinum]MDF5819966.1 glutamyl-tRNA reductase [Corynebacterium felinum]MDR7354547.1 glutamyl-tRNA reductase [Corynebacterium felinum]WJY93914.1 Glutamyl-tRNA reductase [Corynebacterium felinum]